MARYRFGDFDFDATSGELRPLDGGDAGLHFCIRQVSVALGDTAGSPRYVATLPRRGYRLIPPVTPAPAPAGSNGSQASPLVETQPPLAGPKPGLGHWTLALGTFVLLALIAFAATAMARRGAISGAASGEVSGEVIGPSTTAEFDGRRGGLRELCEAYDLELVVNGRFVNDEKGPRMLAELIRSSDGAHIWVKNYPSLEDGDAVGQEIGAAVRAPLVPENDP